jgi:deoxyribonuclease V
MELAREHDLDLTTKEAMLLQEELRGEIVDNLSFDPRAVKIVAGTDISYLRELRLAMGVAVVMTFPDLEIVEESRTAVRVSFPYVPGLLSFRELPALLPALKALENEPDLIFVDGQGIAHPRGMGIASHLGLLAGKPSIGCAKSRLIGEAEEPDLEAGSRKPLIHEGKRIGVVLRTRYSVKPLYVSVGHMIDLETATAMVLACCRGYRLPEPQRRAHAATGEMKLMARSGRLRATGIEA